MSCQLHTRQGARPTSVIQAVVRSGTRTPAIPSDGQCTHARPMVLIASAMPTDSSRAYSASRPAVAARSTSAVRGRRYTRCPAAAAVRCPPSLADTAGQRVPQAASSSRRSPTSSTRSRSVQRPLLVFHEGGITAPARTIPWRSSWTSPNAVSRGVACGIEVVAQNGSTNCDGERHSGAAISRSGGGWRKRASLFAGVLGHGWRAGGHGKASARAWATRLPAEKFRNSGCSRRNRVTISRT